MVIAQSMLSEAAGGVGEARSVRFNAAIEKIERHTRDLRESVMSVRMVPIGSVFARFTRVVHDMAAALGKSAQLQIEGGESEIDKVLTERLVDPLTHLVRNSLDHGIETPATRRAAGKPDAGTIVLRASHNSGQIVIEVSDDGAGLDRERILAKAAERGIAIDEAAPDALVWDLIFAPGFSTAGEISDVSGRGVGMDVVRRNVAALRGSVEIQSTADAGTRTIIRMPLTLAILDGLSVSVGDETFIVPLTAIVESVPVSRAKIAHLHRRGRVMEFRANEAATIDEPVVPRRVDFRRFAQRSVRHRRARTGEPGRDGVRGRRRSGCAARRRAQQRAASRHQERRDAFSRRRWRRGCDRPRDRPRRAHSRSRGTASDGRRRGRPAERTRKDSRTCLTRRNGCTSS